MQNKRETDAWRPPVRIRSFEVLDAWLWKNPQYPFRRGRLQDWVTVVSTWVNCEDLVSKQFKLSARKKWEIEWLEGVKELKEQGSGMEREFQECSPGWDSDSGVAEVQRRVGLRNWDNQEMNEFEFDDLAYWWRLQRSGSIYSLPFNKQSLSRVCVAGSVLDTFDLDKEGKRRGRVTGNSIHIGAFHFPGSVLRSVLITTLVVAILSSSSFLSFPFICFGSWAVPLLCTEVNSYPPAAKPSSPGIYCIRRWVCTSHFCAQEHSDEYHASIRHQVFVSLPPTSCTAL